MLRTLCLPPSADVQVTVVPGATVRSWGESFDPIATVRALAAALAAGACAANAAVPATPSRPATSSRQPRAARRVSPVATCLRMLRSSV